MNMNQSCDLAQPSCSRKCKQTHWRTQIFLSITFTQRTQSTGEDELILLGLHDKRVKVISSHTDAAENAWQYMISDI